MANVKKRPSFTLLIWLLILFCAGYNTCWPLIENSWAAHMWEKVPCANMEGGKFLFDYNGARYYSVRQDFWMRTTVNSTRSDSDIEQHRVYDQTCYVKPGDPTWAVKNVDAEKHIFDHGFHGLMVAVFILVAGIILTFAARRIPAPPPAPRNTQTDIKEP